MRSTQVMFKFVTAFAGVLGLVMLGSPAAVAVSIPTQPSGLYDDIKHDVARRGGGGGRKAGRGGGRRGGFRGGRGGGRAFRGGGRGGRAFRGGRGPRQGFRGKRGPGRKFRGPGRGGRYAYRNGRKRKYGRTWKRGRYGRRWKRNRYGRLWKPRSNLRKRRRYGYGKRYTYAPSYNYYSGYYDRYALPWALWNSYKLYKDYGYGDDAPYYNDAIDGEVAPDQEYICRVLYEAAIASNTPYEWDQFYSTCGKPEDYAWYEDVPPPPELPEPPSEK